MVFFFSSFLHLRLLTLLLVGGRTIGGRGSGQQHVLPTHCQPIAAG